jgi:hypothetical protein
VTGAEANRQYVSDLLMGWVAPDVNLELVHFAGRLPEVLECAWCTPRDGHDRSCPLRPSETNIQTASETNIQTADLANNVNRRLAVT